ncbi:hypothetical protein [Streptomyces sp. NPDC088733]|uniref:hypothetical protein n=1 Tax=Streptomyces sp. NPDC088733 TaxID=3365880 RepID=UPI00380657F6
MPDVGDLAAARLAVNPADGTTAATLLVTRPDGTTASPVVTGADGGATWTAPVTYTLAGVWVLDWTVTGTGAGREIQRVAVAPGIVVETGRVYANSTQLANYLGAAPPLDADRLLARASEMLDAEVLLTAVYDTDDDGMPTDPQVAAAFALAACAQVEFWGEVGEDTDTAGPIQGVSIGSAQIQYGAGDNRVSPTTSGARVYRAFAVLPADKFRQGVATGSCGWR